jgi:hypothetical protein
MGPIDDVLRILCTSLPGQWKGREHEQLQLCSRVSSTRGRSSRGAYGIRYITKFAAMWLASLRSLTLLQMTECSSFST